jgi:uncharacterized protein YecA (UPF0149 family)
VKQEDRMGLERARTIHNEFETFTTAGPQPEARSPVNQNQLITNRTSEAKREPVRVAKTVGRNDPCPCGSGKKYKQCHGRQ